MNRATCCMTMSTALLFGCAVGDKSPRKTNQDPLIVSGEIPPCIPGNVATSACSCGMLQGSTEICGLGEICRLTTTNGGICTMPDCPRDRVLTDRCACGLGSNICTPGQVCGFGQCIEACAAWPAVADRTCLCSTGVYCSPGFRCTPDDFTCTNWVPTCQIDGDCIATDPSGNSHCSATGGQIGSCIPGCGEMTCRESYYCDSVTHRCREGCSRSSRCPQNTICKFQSPDDQVGTCEMGCHPGFDDTCELGTICVAVSDTEGSCERGCRTCGGPYCGSSTDDRALCPNSTDDNQRFYRGCPEGQVCHGNFGFLGDCSPRASNACMTNDDCPVGQRCNPMDTRCFDPATLSKAECDAREASGVYWSEDQGRCLIGCYRAPPPAVSDSCELMLRLSCSILETQTYCSVSHQCTVPSEETCIISCPAPHTSLIRSACRDPALRCYINESGEAADPICGDEPQTFEGRCL